MQYFPSSSFDAIRLGKSFTYNGLLSQQYQQQKWLAQLRLLQQTSPFGLNHFQAFGNNNNFLNSQNMTQSIPFFHDGQVFSNHQFQHNEIRENKRAKCVSNSAKRRNSIKENKNLVEEFTPEVHKLDNCFTDLN